MLTFLPLSLLKQHVFLFRVLLLISGVALLPSCGASQSQQAPAILGTTYTLPPTPGGRMCADQCKKAREYCAQSCDLDYRSCYNDVQSSAQQTYDRYVRDRFNTHTPVDLLPSDFEHPDLCNAEKKHCLMDCDRPYNACYTSCGGTVTVTTSCQFLCFE